MCCFDSWDGPDRRGGGCRIEDHGSFSMSNSGAILDRRRDGRRSPPRGAGPQGACGSSLGCGIDAGGRTLTWVDDVKPAESLTLLSSLVASTDETTAKPLDDRTAGRDKVTDSALMAIAAHGRPRTTCSSVSSPPAAGADPQDGVLDGEHARPPRVRSACPLRARTQ
jgi:hypothetical protein